MVKRNDKGRPGRGPDLSGLMKQIESEPVPDRLTALAKQLETRLREQVKTPDTPDDAN